MRISLLLGALLLAANSSIAQNGDCLTCHVDKEGTPVHALMQTAHGKLPQSCEACHGPSLDHKSRPTVVSPDVSYGPRWTANTAEQDGSCLNCHQNNVAKHWNQALHMANNVTCANCHNSHDAEQDLSVAAQQVETCTVCHKNQKTGIHGKERMLRMNPPCTQCHNPHADQRPTGVMLANDSQGCRRCHNLDAMSRSDKVTDKAKSFHLAMSGGELTCIDCHQGLAHGDTDSVEPFLPLPASEKDITLFYPGSSDADWLLTQHAGSQPLRQGTNCRQCHRGEEAEMGASLGSEEPTSRPINASFSAEDGQLITRLSWAGTSEDTTVSMMWGFGNYEPFRRGGCWAACHGDLAGMSMGKQAGIDKYLWSALEQRRQIGQAAVYKSPGDIQAAMDRGEFVEMWQVDLGKATIQTGVLLARVEWLPESPVTADVSFSDGRWTVVLKRPLDASSPLLALDPNKRYTFGAALHGNKHRGGAHWVSLPMTVSVDRDDTDFITR